MEPVKVTISLLASLVGVCLPWRARIIYSEVLGWVAQVVPPRLYLVDDDETE